MVASACCDHSFKSTIRSSLIQPFAIHRQTAPNIFERINDISPKSVVIEAAFCQRLIGIYRCVQGGVVAMLEHELMRAPPYSAVRGHVVACSSITSQSFARVSSSIAISIAANWSDLAVICASNSFRSAFEPFSLNEAVILR